MILHSSPKSSLGNDPCIPCTIRLLELKYSSKISSWYHYVYVFNVLIIVNYSLFCLATDQFHVLLYMYVYF